MNSKKWRHYSCYYCTFVLCLLSITATTAAAAAIVIVSPHEYRWHVGSHWFFQFNLLVITFLVGHHKVHTPCKKCA